jgi:phosphatidylethanolamine/phosphatidyl-N-methylethanolamine N-methyltransferase
LPDDKGVEDAVKNEKASLLDWSGIHLLEQNRSPFAPRKIKKKEIDLEDEARFLKSWIESPLKTGSVVPSGKALAKKMASLIDLKMEGSIIELGPGTGPVTQALLERGTDPARLILVEYSADFVKLLRNRFPGVTVIQGDAYDLRKTLQPHLHGPVAAVVSSLPLLTRPDGQRVRLLKEALAMMVPGAPFVQFTYMNPSPIPPVEGVTAKVSPRVWKNLPPARVWTYQLLQP